MNKKKRILALNYSQTGQLDQIIDNFLLPFSDYDIDRVYVKLNEDFSFP